LHLAFVPDKKGVFRENSIFCVNCLQIILYKTRAKKIPQPSMVKKSGIRKKIAEKKHLRPTGDFTSHRCLRSEKNISRAKKQLVLNPQNNQILTTMYFNIGNPCQRQFITCQMQWPTTTNQTALVESPLCEPPPQCISNPSLSATPPFIAYKWGGNLLSKDGHGQQLTSYQPPPRIPPPI